MNSIKLSFYSVLKNEDAIPYVDDNLLVVADGLGGSGSGIHEIDRSRYADFYGELKDCVYTNCSPVQGGQAYDEEYVKNLLAPITDEMSHTSALWASRIVMARFVYALGQQGPFHGADLGEESTRAELAKFITEGLRATAAHFQLKKGKYDGQLLLPTTLAAIRCTPCDGAVVAEAIWAGDSRCYALTPEGLRMLSEDNEDSSGLLINLFNAEGAEATLYYKKYIVQTPCIIFVASDGMFDSMEGNDMLGVDATMLKALNSSKSAAQFQRALVKFYDRVHGDDASMAGAAFGVEDFAALKAAFAKRYEYVNGIWQLFTKNSKILDVLDGSGEELCEYIKSRTAAKFGDISNLLAEALLGNRNDPLLTGWFKNWYAEAETTADSYFSCIRTERISDAIEYARCELEACGGNIGGILNINRHFNKRLPKMLKKKLEALNKSAGELRASSGQLSEAVRVCAEIDGRRNKIISEIDRRISDCRSLFDRCAEGVSDVKAFAGYVSAEYFWANIKIGLICRTECDLTTCFKPGMDDKRLLDDIGRYLVKFKTSQSRYVSAQLNRKRKYKEFFSAVENFIKCLSEHHESAVCVLGRAIIEKFNLKFSDLGRAGRTERVRSELQKMFNDRAEEFTAEITSALGKNCGRATIIDGFYNKYKLENYRLYCKYRGGADGEFEAFRGELGAMQAAYDKPCKSICAA